MNVLDGLKGDDKMAKCCMAASKAGLPHWELAMCMYEISLDCLKDMMYKAKPIAPQCLKDFRTYRSTKDFQQLLQVDQKRIRTNIMAKQEVLDFQKETSRIEAENGSNIVWMEKMLDAFREMEDKGKFLQVWNVYSRYPSHLRNDKWGVKKQSTVAMAKEVFGGKEVKDDCPF